MKNSPIMEAIFDIRFSPERQLSLNELEEICKLFESDYPQKEIIRNIAFGISIDELSGEPRHEPKSNQIIGYRIKNNGNNEIYQFKVDGFSFSRLQPYISHEHMLKKSLFALDNIISKYGDIKICRQAVRYINKIVLNNSGIAIDTGDYFHIKPAIPDELSSKESDIKLSAFTSHNLLNDTKTGFNINYISSLDKRDSNFVQIIIDIDIYSNKITNHTDTQSIWEKMIPLKNNIFFMSVNRKNIE